MTSSLVTLGQRVCHHVQAPRPKLDGEVVAEQLGDPRVLRNGRQALAEEELETPMVGSDGERTTPEVRPLITASLDQPNQLTFIC